jgi:hypothetical protein
VSGCRIGKCRCAVSEGSRDIDSGLTVTVRDGKVSWSSATPLTRAQVDNRIRAEWSRLVARANDLQILSLAVRGGVPEKAENDGGV